MVLRGHWPPVALGAPWLVSIALYTGFPGRLFLCLRNADSRLLLPGARFVLSCAGGWQPLNITGAFNIAIRGPLSVLTIFNNLALFCTLFCFE
jgi:hypothetical protein